MCYIRTHAPVCFVYCNTELNKILKMSQTILIFFNIYGAFRYTYNMTPRESTNNKENISTLY